MKKLISAIGFSGDDNEYTFNAQRLNPNVDASITIDNSEHKYIHIGNFIDDSDVIMKVKFNILHYPIYEIYFHKTDIPHPLTRTILIKNISDYNIFQWSYTPTVEVVYVSNTGGEINVLLTIPKKVQSSNPYISTSVKIDISLISGNFNFNLYEMTNETMSAFHGSGNYYSSEPFESNTQVVVPVNPSIKPSKDGALWISTT